MEITLEKIELVKDRTGVSYKDAKEALEKTEGNVVEAIILIEDTIDTAPAEETPSRTSAILTNIKELVHKGNVSRVLISKEGETIINLPVSIGIIGTVLFPWAGVTAAIAALGTKCEIHLTKDDGSVIDISDKVDSGFDTVMSKGGVIVDEVADKSEDFIQFAKEKGGEFVNFAKDKFGKGEKFTAAKESAAETAAEAAEAVEEAVEVVEATVEEAVEELKTEE